MIVDKLENAYKYYNLSENIKKGLQYLENTNFVNLQDGKYEIDGNNIYVSVQEYTTKSIEEGKWEAHKKYTDIQYIADGEETIGFSFFEECSPETNYDEQKDIYFLRGEGSYFKLKKGYFAVFAPTDVHKPSLHTDNPQVVKKVVVKLL